MINAARFPLEVATADAPPLVKFAGTFGILEANEGGVLPVTLRALEAGVAGQALAPIRGRDIDVETDSEVAAWLRRLDKAEERTQAELPIAGSKKKRPVETTRQSPLIASGAPARRRGRSPSPSRTARALLRSSAFRCRRRASTSSNWRRRGSAARCLSQVKFAMSRPVRWSPTWRCIFSGPRSQPRMGDPAQRREAGARRENRGAR